MDTDQFHRAKTELERLMDQEPCDKGKFASLYAAFEREFPRSQLETPAQEKAAAILEEVGLGALAIEAYKKVMDDPRAPEPSRIRARLAAGKLYGRNAATFERMRRLLEPLANTQPNTPEGAEARQLLAAADELARTLLLGVEPGKEDEVREDKGPYSIIAQQGQKLSIPTAGRILADTLGQPLFEVTNALRQFPGFLAGGLALGQSVGLGRALQQEGIDVLIIPESEMLRLPAVEKVKSVKLTGGGFEFEVDGKTAVIAPKQFLLLYSGYLRSSRSQTVSGGGVARGIGYSKLSGIHPTSTPYFTSRLETKTTMIGLADLFVLNPARRLRMKEGEVNLRDLGLSEDPTLRGKFIKMLKALAYSAPTMPLNESLSAVFLDEQPQELEYLSEEAFDRAGQWLVQLEYISRKTGKRGL